MKRYYIQGRELSFNENRLVFDEQFQPVYQIKGSTFSGSQQIYTMDYQTVANLNHSLFEFKTTISQAPFANGHAHQELLGERANFPPVRLASVYD